MANAIKKIEEMFDVILEGNEAETPTSRQEVAMLLYDQMDIADNEIIRMCDNVIAAVRGEEKMNETTSLELNKNEMNLVMYSVGFCYKLYLRDFHAHDLKELNIFDTEAKVIKCFENLNIERINILCEKIFRAHDKIEKPGALL